MGSMITRLHRLTALLALIALSLSVAEKGWAVACSEAGFLSASAAAAPDVPHTQHAPPANGGEPNGDVGGDQSCPMAVNSGMACGLLAVGTSTTSPDLAMELSSRLEPVSDRPVGSGALSSLFRPPQQ